MLCDKCGQPVKPKNRRSVRQNRATFGICYRMIADALTELNGEVVSVDTVHALFKDKFRDILERYSDGPEEIIIGRGMSERRPLSTTRLSTVGMMRYYEAIQKWAAEFLGLDIPGPNEIDYRNMVENTRRGAA